jgi:hypothetical protein
VHVRVRVSYGDGVRTLGGPVPTTAGDGDSLESADVDERAGVSLLASRKPIAAGQKRQDLAYRPLLAAGFGQGQVRLDSVAVAAAIFLLDDVSRLGQILHDAVGAALSDANPVGDVTQAYPRVA